jgi:hypothetical protein
MRTITTTLLLTIAFFGAAQQTQKPPLHGKNWMAVTGKPLAATAGKFDIPKRRQCCGRCMRDAGGHLHDVGCAQLGG